MPAEQVEARRADVERAQVAGLVVADPGAERLARAGSWPRPARPEQVLAEVERVGGDQLGVEVVGQLDVFLAEHQRGGRLGADDGVAVAHGVGQHAEVRQGLVARMIDVADDERGHARAALLRRARRR